MFFPTYYIIPYWYFVNASLIFISYRLRPFIYHEFFVLSFRSSNFSQASVSRVIANSLVARSDRFRSSNIIRANPIHVGAKFTVFMSILCVLISILLLILYHTTMPLKQVYYIQGVRKRYPAEAKKNPLPGNHNQTGEMSSGKTWITASTSPDGQ